MLRIVKKRFLPRLFRETNRCSSLLRNRTLMRNSTISTAIKPTKTASTSTTYQSNITMKIISIIIATLALVSADRANRLGGTSRERNLEEPRLTAKARFTDLLAYVEQDENFVIGELAIEVNDDATSTSCMKLVDVDKYDEQKEKLEDELHNFYSAIEWMEIKSRIRFSANTNDSGACPLRSSERRRKLRVYISCEVHPNCQKIFSTKSSACERFQDSIELKHYENDGNNGCNSETGVCVKHEYKRLYYIECGDEDEGDWFGTSFSQEGFSFRAFITCDDTQVSSFNACSFAVDYFALLEEQFNAILSMPEESQKDAMGVPRNSKGKGYQNKLRLIRTKIEPLETLQKQSKFDSFFENMFFLLRHFEIWFFDSAVKEPIIETLCNIFSKTFEDDPDLDSVYGREKALQICAPYSP